MTRALLKKALGPLDAGYAIYPASDLHKSIRAHLAQPDTAPAHTEAEVQEILDCIDKHLMAFSEPVVRRILKVSAP